jgi:hypothetical protein
MPSLDGDMKNNFLIFRPSSLLLLLVVSVAPAQSKLPQTSPLPTTWMGYTWHLAANGSCIGSCDIHSDSSNLSVDSSGALHIKISKDGGTWTGAEMFTSEKLGFGTYQWVLKGNNFYNMDPPVVLGLFTYGPAGGIGVDGTDEVDIEFSKWNTAPGKQNVDFTAYPATGHKETENKSKEAKPSSDRTFYIPSPAASISTTTVRFVWSSASISWYVMSGTVSVNSAPTKILQSYTYTGTSTTIPQAAAPVGINLWSFEGLPSNPWDITIESFTYSQ